MEEIEVKGIIFVIREFTWSCKVMIDLGEIIEKLYGSIYLILYYMFIVIFIGILK